MKTFGEINREIKGYGFNYSLKDFSKTFFMITVATLGAAYLFGLDFWFIVAIAIFMILLMPYVYRSQFKYLYEQKRFEDASLYISQMIASFKKTSKILPSLLEVRNVVGDEIGAYIDEAIEYIREGEFEDNIYKEALSIIEERYNCSRIKSLHSFLIKVETNGGKFDKAMNLLLEDVDDWTSRVFLYQKDRKSIKNKITIGIFLSFIISISTVIMIPDNFNIINLNVYQIVTTAVVLIMYGFYVFVQSKLTGSWLDYNNKYTEAKIDKDIDIVKYYSIKAGTIKMIPLIVLIVGAMAWFFVSKNYTYCVISLVVAFIILNQPKTRKKMAKKRLQKEINKVFPDWLRDLSLELQTKTVRVAIASSYSNAPYILRPAIEKLVNSFNEDLSITPYTDFLKEYDIREITQIMRMLYSLNEADKDDSEIQISAIIKRNNELLAKSENLKNEDSIGALGFIIIVPLFIGSLKLIVDLLLLMSTFMGSIQLG